MSDADGSGTLLHQKMSDAEVGDGDILVEKDDVVSAVQTHMNLRDIGLWTGSAWSTREPERIRLNMGKNVKQQPQTPKL